MIATVNVPGSQHFRWHRGTRKECLEWLDRTRTEYKHRFGWTWPWAYGPGQIITERDARTWRYQDGSRVFDCFDPDAEVDPDW